ncbi:putative mitochondrion organization and biogenesis-related protein [Papiliotrema laurentii]|uniref:Mitochondrial distribution and morphology protein 12 n=1 Tax=Papiliotrema laurentii TaxID=5418 RepID=A0AAD9FUC4_PAPLA|nr:putative mitochondrion organization and biogenesis-related protein [Papiliotrema laurentii]
MSLDIDWSLLNPTALSSNLVGLLNTHLASASRPSFIGPITVTSFDFGTAAPDVEIKDIRDVWRAFDEGDEEGDDEVASAAAIAGANGYGGGRRGVGASGGTSSGTLEDEYERVPSNGTRPGGGGGGGGAGAGVDGDDFDDLASVYSGLASPRQSVAAVGIGMNSSAIRDYASAILPPLSARGMSRNGSLFSPNPLALPARGRGGRTSTAPPLSASHRRHHSPLPPHHTSPPPSPPARPAGVAESKSSIPSLQLHLKVNYISDLHLTLLTSLTINYPSPGFMSLPLKLSITGLALGADVVLAYSGDKHRVHLCLIDEDEATHPNVPVGQRILPTLSIDSEIGQTDAHVLRNVGKVERFIADVVRKTLVDELVFPNFLTLAL